MNAVADKPFEAAEAFALMWYGCKCGHRERIWNSRPGVTPFCMGCPSCGEGSLQHIQWGMDQRAEHHKPHFGQRLWIDLTIEKAREEARRQFASYPPDEIERVKEQFGSVEEAVERIAQHNYASFGAGTSPDMVVVGTASRKRNAD